PGSQGRRFEVDMRLLQTGTQGPVATSWTSFQSYQTSEAWVWEHMALTRAKVVAGPDNLALDVTTFLEHLLRNKRTRDEVVLEVSQMRARIQAAKTPASLWDAKIGPGRLQDIEMLAQAGALIDGNAKGEIDAGLTAAVASGLLSDAEGRDLKSLYASYSKLYQATRLLSDKPLDVETLGPAGKSFVLRALEEETMECLEKRLSVSYTRSGAILDASLSIKNAENDP
ncbi:MAG: glutamine-synthetase adenylyltransferase, partial [Roseobacter sp.]